MRLFQWTTLGFRSSNYETGVEKIGSYKDQKDPLVAQRRRMCPTRFSPNSCKRSRISLIEGLS